MMLEDKANTLTAQAGDFGFGEGAGFSAIDEQPATAGSIQQANHLTQPEADAGRLLLNPM